MLGSQDLIVGLVVVLVLFGAKKLPELAGSIGKSLKEFKKGVSEATEEEPAKGAGPPAAPAPAIYATSPTIAAVKGALAEVTTFSPEVIAASITRTPTFGLPPVNIFTER